MTEEAEVDEVRNLDDLNRRDWPAECTKALDGWKQGDIVKTGPTAFWIGAGGVDPITGVDGLMPEAARVLASVSGHVTGLGVITSQTCDVAGLGPGAKHPWVTVCPIVRFTDSAKFGDLRRGRLGTHVLISNERAPSVAAPPQSKPGWLLAIDLRLTFSVSKSVLTDQVPVPAFDEADALEFAVRLAAKAGRSALHDVLAGSLARFIGERVVAAQAEGTWPAFVEQFRVAVTRGTRLNPRLVTLLVLTDGDADADFSKLMNRWLASWKKQAKKVINDAGVDVEKADVWSLADIPVARYRDSAHLPVEAMTRQFFH